MTNKLIQKKSDYIAEIKRMVIDEVIRAMKYDFEDQEWLEHVIELLNKIKNSYE